MTYPSSRRDLLAGGTVLLAGIGAAAESMRYTLGTLTAMGPGFFPLILGAALILLGAVIAFGGEPAQETEAFGTPDWRGWCCIAGGLLAFVALGERAGLAPACFATVFIAALGDRQTSMRAAAALACGLTVFAVVLFSLVLQLQLPIVTGLAE